MRAEPWRMIRTDHGSPEVCYTSNHCPCWGCANIKSHLSSQLTPSQSRLDSTYQTFCWEACWIKCTVFALHCLHFLHVPSHLGPRPGNEKKKKKSEYSSVLHRNRSHLHQLQCVFVGVNECQCLHDRREEAVSAGYHEILNTLPMSFLTIHVTRQWADRRVTTFLPLWWLFSAYKSTINNQSADGFTHFTHI